MLTKVLSILGLNLFLILCSSSNSKTFSMVLEIKVELICNVEGLTYILISFNYIDILLMGCWVFLI